MKVVEGKQNVMDKEVDKGDFVIDKNSDSKTPVHETNQNDLAWSDKQVKETESNTILYCDKWKI